MSSTGMTPYLAVIPRFIRGISNANSGLKENRKGRKQGKLSNYKKIDEVTHGRYNKTVLFGR
ncbi:hypothetical protein [Wolbachia endosymbiont (group A) of Icerya purchasi]|uniref:hypothetical protein n=1 Tax=Wolbachia endosymbiont (group A) of Icerya purchasi TaxID=2954019 RepID=UPI00222E2275|nr:hypothetical protein [Wolbachia endosymbiont (group A) of Icerya purchasi]